MDYLDYGRINKVDGRVANKHGANQSSKAEAGAVPAADLCGLSLTWAKTNLGEPSP